MRALRTLVLWLRLAGQAFKLSILARNAQDKTKLVDDGLMPLRWNPAKSPYWRRTEERQANQPPTIKK